MALPLAIPIVQGGLSLIGSGIKYFQSRNQKKRAQQIRASNIDPGIRPNQEVRQVRDLLYDRYSNYQLPGFDSYLSDIRQNAGSTMYNVQQGASSSADITAGLIGSQMATNRQLGELTKMQVSGEEQALMAYLESLNAVGNDNVRMNNLELQRYEQAMAEADALEGAATQNKFGAISDLTTTASAMASMFMPRATTSQSGSVEYLSPIDTYRIKRQNV